MTYDKKEIIEKVSNWLQEEGVSFTHKPNAYVEVDLALDYPNGSKIDIFFEKKNVDSMSIAAKVIFSDADMKTFANLKQDLKSEFLIALSSSLCMMNLHQSVKPNPEKMEFLLIEKRLFFDALTKDRFFDTLDRVLSGIGLSSLTYSKYLSKGKNSGVYYQVFFSCNTLTYHPVKTPDKLPELKVERSKYIASDIAI